MLHARKIGFWKRTYDITADGRPVTTWTGRTWKAGGVLELNGQAYEVSANLWGNRYEMSTKDGTAVASAERVGRKQWTVTADGRSYRFRRASVWSGDQILVDGDHEVGSVRKTSFWSSDAEANLPGLSPATQLFVLIVVLSMWEASEAASGG